MDGIPVKINEKYKPPPKISLPSCILNRLNNLQFTGYSYDFSLETTVGEHMAKLNRISREEIEKHDAKVSHTPEVSPEKSGKVFCENGANNESAILTPVPISTNNPVSSLQKENKFKYSDFENDTSSPFDNEELKTLNDLEELAHVLGATSVRDDSTTVRTNEWSQVNYGSPSQSQFYTNSYAPISMPTTHPTMTYSSQIPLNSYQGNYSSYGVPISNSNPSFQRNDVNEDGERVSEIVKSLQEYLGQRKVNVSSSKQVVVQPVVEETVSSSFKTLSDQEQAMALRVGEMGFPLSRTTAAVQHFGLDESKIIEYLFLVQSFVDKGYTESQTIHALEVTQCDETAAENYLKILSQIMKLGFKQEEVVTALARTKNDRDKALDILIR